MSVIGEVLGGGHSFEHGGKTYRVSLITQGIKLEFEKQLFARARDSAKALRECMDRDQYANHIKALNDDYIAGEYAFESKRGIDCVKTVKGMTLLSSLLFGTGEDEMLKLLMERKDDVSNMLQLVFQESFPQLEPQDAAEGAVREEGVEKKVTHA